MLRIIGENVIFDLPVLIGENFLAVFVSSKSLLKIRLFDLDDAISGHFIQKSFQLQFSKLTMGDGFIELVMWANMDVEIKFIFLF